MTPEQAAPEQGKKRHLPGWLVVGALSVLAWGGWSTYAFQSAVNQANALGWEWIHREPFGEIRKDWKTAFRKATWSDETRGLYISNGGDFQRHRNVIVRLQPGHLAIEDAGGVRDLNAILGIPSLKWFEIRKCNELENIRALASLPELETLWIDRATGLTEFSPLKGLMRMRDLRLYGCAGLVDLDALSGMSDLHDLYLPGCKGLQNLNGIKGLTNLSWLDLSDCHALTDVDALKGLSGLQVLSLDGCTGLKSVDGLRGLPSLRNISVNRCTGLPPDAITALRLAMPNATVDSIEK